MSEMKNKKIRDQDVDDDAMEEEHEEEEDNEVNGEGGDDDGSGVKWSMDAYVSNANYHVKKMTFILFINRVFAPPPLISNSNLC
jgi:hypothetical protein